MTVSTMDGRLLRHALGALLTCLVALVLATPAHAAAAFSRCADLPRSDTSRCTTVTVPLDRTGTVPGDVRLHVRALAPKGTPTGAVMELAGGPGQAAAPILNPIANELGSILAHRTLITFDQRGTGDSDPLRCAALARDASSLAAATTACAEEIGPRRAFFRTDDSVADIEAVRAALDVDRLILVGTSYGTKVALEYAAAYPQHVERLVLDSVVGSDGEDPFAVATIQAIPGMLRNVCRGGACPFTADPAADLAALVAKVRETPLPAVVYDFDGRPQRWKIDEATVLGNILVADVDAGIRASLPSALHSALLGDGGPLLALGFGGNFSPVLEPDTEADALFTATLCEDGRTVWPAGTPIDQRGPLVDAAVAALAPESVAPFAPQVVADVSGTSKFCLGWPDAPLAQAAVTPPTVPTLILSGGDDLRTPPADAAAIAATLPDVQLLTVPDSGHSVGSTDTTGCAHRAMVAFLAGGRVAACRVPRRQEGAVAAVAPATLADVAPIAGLPLKVGRTLAAVRATLPDLLLRAGWGSTKGKALAVGGLRGGREILTLAGASPTITLHRYSYVPGVTLSGHYTAPEHGGTLTIGGTGAHGTLRYDATAHTISGRLGGRRVALRVPADLLLEANSHPAVVQG
jgi:pimeloyl-ACP methyl ester carboxylesterase